MRPVSSFLPAVALLTTALLSGCGQPPVIIIEEPPITAPPAVKPQTLGNTRVNLGQNLYATVNISFDGSWRIDADRPDWLRFSALAGTGDVRLTISADRSLATALAAQNPQLSDVLKISWTGGTASQPQSGVATWTVTADQFLLTGRVVRGPAVQGQDVSQGTQERRVPATQARGILVKYRDLQGGGDQPASTGTSSTGPSSTGPSSTGPSSTGSAADPSGETPALAARSLSTLKAAGLTKVTAQVVVGRTLRLQAEDSAVALAALRRDPLVEYAVPNAVLSAQALAQPVEPTDQYAPLQWPFRLLGYPAVWRDMDGGAYRKAVTVAVIDTGVRFDHPDLAGQVWTANEGALDVLDAIVDTQTGQDNGDGDGPDTDPTDPSVPGRIHGSHGTHVTGLIVARWGENAPSCAQCSRTGLVGAAYKAPVKVLPIRALDANGDTALSDVIHAVRYAAGLPVTLAGKTYLNPHPAQVMNLSLGGAISPQEAQPMCEAIQEARTAGSLVVVAAGNGYGTSPYYPAACPAAVAVGAVTLSGGSAPRKAVYSNTYPQVQLSAPGGSHLRVDYTTYNGGLLNGQPAPDDVFSTSWDYAKNEPNFEWQAGTSQAAPQVAALAALLLSKGVTADAQSTLDRLIATATDLGASGRDETFGYGMINAAAALNAPAISDTLGLRLQDARGKVFQPELDALGRFQAYLGDGTYTVTAGHDRDGNGVYGETHEPQVQKTVVLGPADPAVHLGDLQPQ